MRGRGAGRILFHHILPNIAGPVLIVATAEFGLMILMEAGLSFLGLGIQPPASSWGSIMSVGRQYIERAWWIVAFPGACLFLLVFSVNVLGDWLRDQLDPRSRTR
ncbi:ABC transporter permease subunit (plasmid) [Neorhizobium galegae]|nr:ABC transporter permease subunit [Neorhizobium galegae]